MGRWLHRITKRAGPTRQCRYEGGVMELVGVVGCGLMGSGIAEVHARAGIDVVVLERDESALASGRSRIESSFRTALAHRRWLFQCGLCRRSRLEPIPREAHRTLPCQLR